MKLIYELMLPEAIFFFRAINEFFTKNKVKIMSFINIISEDGHSLLERLL
jgi:hypothetical protein